ncbi:hypothetical protein SDC9_120715 [bioreactor metagenome]|uniref:Uncharacterized protein n=1 Tax=bioreactor metagenome TaxID=1076179 RepID=A0A645C9Y5_9ZZZZ
MVQLVISFIFIAYISDGVSSFPGETIGFVVLIGYIFGNHSAIIPVIAVMLVTIVRIIY